MRALTLTLHPAIDRVISVEQLVPGGTFDGSLSLLVPAGKGVNTARSLRCVQPSAKISAVVWLGEAEKSWFTHELKRISGVRAVVCARDCATRIAQTFLERDARETHIKEAMPSPSSAEQRALIACCRKAIGAGDILALCGSAPKGTPAATLKQIFKTATGAAIAVADTNGEALKIAAQAKLHGVKGNAREIGELAGANRALDPHAPEDQAILSQLLSKRGAPKRILMTMGASGGALITREHLLFAAAPQLPAGKFRSATGCGDAATAGWMWGLAEQAPDDVCLARAIACGSAKAASADPGMIDPDLMRKLLKRIQVETLHLSSPR
ncbi:MAG TPA: PfkB family carbohydrate kinase [Planctomycetota bacterium]|nr:PfkB family carbohydrate kinase [Planctomycetota bacterium]